MNSVRSSSPERRRKQLILDVKGALRDLRSQLSLLNHQVCTRIDLKDVDLDCLDLVNRLGPLGPSTLARRLGLHPATMTGVLDRLQRGGWVTRERDPRATDRRAVTVRALRERDRELLRLYSGMNSSISEICGRYTATELDVIVDFLSRTAEAGHDAVEELAAR